jgi:hypothetical protein
MKYIKKFENKLDINRLTNKWKSIKYIDDILYVNVYNLCDEFEKTITSHETRYEKEVEYYDLIENLIKGKLIEFYDITEKVKGICDGVTFRSSDVGFGIQDYDEDDEDDDNPYYINLSHMILNVEGSNVNHVISEDDTIKIYSDQEKEYFEYTIKYNL